MACRIDDAAVLRIINAQVTAAISGAATRMLGEEAAALVSGAEVVTGLQIDPTPRTSTSDQDRAGLTLTLEASVGISQASDLAIGTLASELVAALEEQNLPDSTALGGGVTPTEHVVSFTRARRLYGSATTADNRRVPTCQITLQGVALRRSEETREDFLT